MSFRYHIEVSERLLVMRFEGRVDIKVLADYVAAMQADPDRTPDQNCLCDMSRVEEVDLDFPQVMGMTSTRANFYERSMNVRVGVWAPSDMVFGMVRMYLAMLQNYDGISADVFPDLAQAAAFVGCDATVLDRL